MDPLNLTTEGMTDAEQMLLSMIFSFASDQLTRHWTVQQGQPSDVVIYDISNPRARLAWERHRHVSHPIPAMAGMIKQPHDHRPNRPSRTSAVS